MRLFSSRKKRSKQTSLTPRRLSSPWRTFKPRLEQLEERTLLNAGALDSAFGIGGKVTTHFGGFDNGRELAIQPDGKIVVVGSEVVNGVSDFGLARYNSDGSLDSTFGTGGEVTTDVGGNGDPDGVVILPNGKILVAGQGSNGGSSTAFALAQYTASGSLDITFGTGGEVFTKFTSGNDFAVGLAVQADGKIVVAGNTNFNGTYGHSDSALARYNPDGSLDTTFGTGGQVTINVADHIHRLAIQSDGRIVVAGDRNTGSSWDFALARFNTGGTLDVSFGTGGVVTTDFHGGYDSARGLAIQPDGKIVAVGYGTNDPTVGPDFGLARYNSNGTLDTTFGTGGKVTTDFSGFFDEADAVAILGNGKIVAAGQAYSGTNSSTSDFALARYNADGSLDTSFGTGGKVTTVFNSGNDFIGGIAIQRNGEIVAAGEANYNTEGDFALARYTSYTINEFPLPTPNSLPNAIVAGPDGNVWFMEANRDTIGRITPAGQISEVLLPVPAGNANFVFAPDGNIWLGLRTDIAEITPQGVLLHDYLIPSASPPGIPDTGLVVTMGPDGNIWYTEPYTNDLIGRLTPEGQITEFPVPGDALGRAGAANIISGPDGNLWFGAVGNDSKYVGSISTAGVIQIFAIPDGSPRGLTSGLDGNLWMTAADNGYSNEILRVNTQGQLTGQFAIPTPNSVAYAMTVGSDGALWFGESNVSQIGRITTDGNITEIPIASGNRPNGITAGPDGNIWFSEYYPNSIGEVVLQHPRVNWINPAGGDWDTASNWRDDQGVSRVPGANDQAIIDIPPQNAFTVTHSSSAADSVYSLNSQDDLSVSGGSLSVVTVSYLNQGLTWSGGTLGGTGNLTVSGMLSWSGGTLSGAAGTILRADGGITVSGLDSVLDTRDLVNAGAAVVLGGFDVTGGADVDNLAGATFDLRTSAGEQLNGVGHYPQPSRGGRFTNAGLLTSEAAGTNAVDLAFHNSGTVHVYSGQLILLGSDASGPTSSGVITGDPGTLILFGSDGVHPVADDFTPTSSISGDQVWFASGSFDVQGAYSAHGTATYNGAAVTFDGATVPQVGNLVVHTIGRDGDIVTFNSSTAAGTATVTLNGLALGDNSFPGGSGNATLAGMDNIVVSGLFTWDGGTLTGAPGTSLTLAANGRLTVIGYPNLLDTRNLVNAGAAVVTGGFDVSGGADVDNLAGATFDLRTSAGDFGNGIGNFPQPSRGGRFNNAGVLTSEAADANAVWLAFHNSGTVAVHSGRLTLLGNDGTVPTSSGLITGDLGTTLQFGGPATDVFTPGSVLAADRVLFNGGSFELEGSYSANATATINGAAVTFDGTTVPHVGDLAVHTIGRDGDIVTFNSSTAAGTATVTLNGLALGDNSFPGGSGNATLAGMDNIVVSGLFIWDGGTLTGAPGTSLTASGGMTITSGVVERSSLVNAGTATWIGGTVLIGNGASFTNTDTGTFNDQIDGSFGGNGSDCPIFTNQGLFLKSGSTGTTNLEMQLNNSGTVRIDQGILNLGCGYVQGSGGSISGSVSGSVSNPGTYNSAPSSNPPPLLTSYTQTVTGTLYEQIGGLTAGTQYGQLIVNGDVNLAGSLQVVLINAFTPQLGNKFTIIDNRGSNPINGTFNNVPEGATVWSGPYGFAISYVGGTGNDVVLTVVAVTAQQQIAIISSQVNALVNAGVLNSGNGNALTAKLNSATASLNATPPNKTAAVNQLNNAFINQAQAFEKAFQKAGNLSSAQAMASLISAANVAINAIQGSGARLLDGTNADTSATGDSQPVTNAGQLVTGSIGVYLDNADGAPLTADEQARFDDAIARLDATFGPFGVMLVDVGAGDAADAVVQVEIGGISAAGSSADGVLGCTLAGHITLLTGWNWYTGADPAAIGAGQYDFETIVMHELGHSIGLGHSGDTSSVMYAFLAPGATRRLVTAQDLSVLDSGGSTVPEPLTAEPWRDRQVTVADLNLIEPPQGPDRERAAPPLWTGVYLFGNPAAGEQSVTTRGDQQGDSRLTLTAERPDVRSHAERGNEGEENWSTMNFANAAGQLLEKDPSEELLRHSRPINAQDLDDFWSSFAATRLFANTL